MPKCAIARCLILVVGVACHEDPAASPERGPTAGSTPRPSAADQVRGQDARDRLSDLTVAPPGNALEVTLELDADQWTATCGGRTRTNELRIPVDRPVRFEIESAAAVTLEFVPFRVRRDILPGRATRVWLQAEKTGSWPIRLTWQGKSREIGSITVLTAEEFARDP